MAQRVVGARASEKPAAPTAGVKGIRRDLPAPPRSGSKPKTAVSRSRCANATPQECSSITASSRSSGPGLGMGPRHASGGHRPSRCGPRVRRRNASHAVRAHRLLMLRRAVLDRSTRGVSTLRAPCAVRRTPPRSSWAADLPTRRTPTIRRRAGVVPSRKISTRFGAKSSAV